MLFFHFLLEKENVWNRLVKHWRRCSFFYYNFFLFKFIMEIYWTFPKIWIQSGHQFYVFFPNMVKHGRVKSIYIFALKSSWPNVYRKKLAKFPGKRLGRSSSLAKLQTKESITGCFSWDFEKLCISATLYNTNQKQPSEMFCKIRCFWSCRS